MYVSCGSDDGGTAWVVCVSIGPSGMLQVQTDDLERAVVDDAALSFTDWTPSSDIAAFIRSTGSLMLSELARNASSRAFEGTQPVGSFFFSLSI